jgi:hypothetical protein
VATVAKGNLFQEIAGRVRADILKGRLAPGSRLPTWDQLTKKYEVARPTLMRAIESLKRDGFVYSRSTRGTYVSERPPHLSRFGLVFASHPTDGSHAGWNRFWSTLASQAPVLERICDVQLPVFYDSCTPEGQHRLGKELARDCLAGLILIGRPDLLRLELVRQADVPKVAVYGGEEVPDIPRVYIDHDSFIRKSLSCLRDQDVKDVAVVSNDTDRWTAFGEAIERAGFGTKPFWRLAGVGRAVTPLVRLLFDADSAHVPDGLIIADDNIVEHAVAGVLQAEVRVPQDLKVVTHCNWPAPVPSVVPVTRLGYDVRELLARCIEQLNRLREGEPVSNVCLIEATTEQTYAVK